jgi:hypothetical protein
MIGNVQAAVLKRRSDMSELLELLPSDVWSLVSLRAA